GEGGELAVGRVDEVCSAVGAAAVCLDRGGVFGELHRPAGSGEADVVDDAGELPAAGGVEDGGGLGSLGDLVVANPSLDVDGAVVLGEPVAGFEGGFAVRGSEERAAFGVGGPGALFEGGVGEGGRLDAV